MGCSGRRMPRLETEQQREGETEELGNDHKSVSLPRATDPALISQRLEAKAEITGSRKNNLWKKIACRSQRYMKVLLQSRGRDCKTTPGYCTDWLIPWCFCTANSFVWNEKSLWTWVTKMVLDEVSRERRCGQDCSSFSIEADLGWLGWYWDDQTARRNERWDQNMEFKSHISQKQEESRKFLAPGTLHQLPQVNAPPLSPDRLCTCVLSFPWWLPWWLKVKASASNAGGPGFDPWVGKITWRRKWQPTPVFLPGESCGWATVHRVTKSRTRLSDFTFTTFLSFPSDFTSLLLSLTFHCSPLPCPSLCLSLCLCFCLVFAIWSSNLQLSLCLCLHGNSGFC